MAMCVAGCVVMCGVDIVFMSVDVVTVGGYVVVVVVGCC